MFLAANTISQKAFSVSLSSPSVMYKSEVTFWAVSTVIYLFFAGNYPQPSNYGGSGSYSGRGPGMTNCMGMNSTSPMQGQGPSQPAPVERSHGPLNHNRGYPPVAPSSPSMPQSAGMGPPSLGASNRKSQDTPSSMPGSANSTHNR